jgi:hypothetical protein
MSRITLAIIVPFEDFEFCGSGSTYKKVIIIHQFEICNPLSMKLVPFNLRYLLKIIDIVNEVIYN